MNSLEQRIVHHPELGLEYAEAYPDEAPQVLQLILPRLNAEQFLQALELAVPLDVPELRRELAEEAIRREIELSEKYLQLFLADEDPAARARALVLFDRFASKNPERVSRYLHEENPDLAARAAKHILTSAAAPNMFAREDALRRVLELRRFDILAEALDRHPELAPSVARSLRWKELEPDPYLARVLLKTGIGRLGPAEDVAAALTTVFRYFPEELEAVFASGCGKSFAEAIRALDTPLAARVIRAAAKSSRIEAGELAAALAALFSESTDKKWPAGRRRDREPDVFFALDSIVAEELPHCELLPDSLHRRDAAVEKQFEESASGALTLKLAGEPGTPEQIRRLVERWWKEQATAEEWGLLLPVAAVNRARCLPIAILRAPPEAVAALGELGADAGLVERAAERSDALEVLTALARRSSDREAAGWARALLAARGGQLAPPDDLGICVDTLSAMHLRDGVEYTAEQRAYADAVLAAPRELVLVHDKLARALHALVRLAGAAAIELWIEAIPRPNVDSYTGYLLREVRALEQAPRLAAALSALPSERLDKILSENKLAPELAIVWARSPKTPVVLRAHAAWAVIQQEDFDPAKYDLSRDIDLAARILALRRFSANNYPVALAVRELARAAGDGDDRAAELRTQVLELCRSERMAALVLETLIDFLRNQLRNTKGVRSAHPRKLLAWIEAAGWTRDIRFADDLKKIAQQLQAPENAELVEPLKIALSEIHKQSAMNAAGVVKLALRSLA